MQTNHFSLGLRRIDTKLRRQVFEAKILHILVSIVQQHVIRRDWSQQGKKKHFNIDFNTVIF